MQKAPGGYDLDAQRDIVAQARSRIDEVRKRDVELRLVDRAGKPLAGMPVEIVQTANEFKVGDQVGRLGTMRSDGHENTYRAECYRRRFAEALTAANCLCYWTERPGSSIPKTEEFEGHEELDGFQYCVDWALSEGLAVKGHQLFWSIAKAVPEWLKRYDYQTQMKFLEVRVRRLANRFRGKVTIWDATNEAVWEPTFKNLPDRYWPHIDSPDEIADYVA